MRSSMNFQVLRAGEHLQAVGKVARKRFLASMDSYMVDQLVLGLERAAIARTVLPVAGMGCAFRASNMVHRQMTDDVLHQGVPFTTNLPGSGVNPLARKVLLSTSRYIANKSAVRGRHMMVVVLKSSCLWRIPITSPRVRVQWMWVPLVVMMVMVVRQQWIIQMVHIWKEHLIASARGCWPHSRAEFIVIPSFEEVVPILRGMGGQMRGQVMAISCGGRLVVMRMRVSCWVEVVLLVQPWAQHLATVFRRLWRRTHLNAHAGSSEATVDGERCVNHGCNISLKVLSLIQVLQVAPIQQSTFITCDPKHNTTIRNQRN